ncbi:MAG: DEAD/DEAH box helicase [Desulfobacterales bacterium]|jgi:ATP-dependent RNA helicase RhlB|nr:DEAD/DEAH box helicase [Desulfobacterales bacterium]
MKKSTQPEHPGIRRRTVRKTSREVQRSKQEQPATRDQILEDHWNPSEFKVPPAEGKTRFHDFDFPDPLLHAVYDLGFAYCTPIQAEILPSTLSGRDAFGRAQTGTGKTAAFLITVINRLLNNPMPDQRKSGAPRVLIIAPTRELVLQISEEARQLTKYCGIVTISIFGGMDYSKQKKLLAGGLVDIVVATPGRLLDFSHRRDISLNKVEMLVIDEADRMMDMGFIPDVRKIIYSTPPREKRQTMLFSATLTEDITRLALSWTINPVTVEIDPEQVAVNTVDQIIYIVTAREKFALLLNIIIRQELKSVLIFCNRRDEVSRLAGMLTQYGIHCAELSGDVHQKKRIERLDAFKSGKLRALVATDVAARGIHVEGMDHVINFTLPHDPEDYVHRIGRTGRAGAAGTSISFADEEDAFYIPAIESFMGRHLDCIEPDDAWLILPEPVEIKKKRIRRRRRPVKGQAG